MNSHQVDATVQADGTLLLRDLPFAAGESVRVMIVSAGANAQPLPWQSLRGTLIKYDDPFEPAVPPDDWEVNQ